MLSCVGVDILAIGHAAAQALYRWVNSLMCHCLRNCDWLLTHSMDSWLLCSFHLLSIMPFPHAHLTIEAFAQANHSRGPRARGENHAAEDISSSTAYLNLLDDVGSTLIITYSIFFNLIVTHCYLAEVFVKPYNSRIASKMEVALSESTYHLTLDIFDQNIPIPWFYVSTCLY